jgi:hypothetical protein
MGIFGRGFISLCVLAGVAGAASAQSVRVLGQSVADVDGRGGFTLTQPDSGFETAFAGTRLTVTLEDTGKNWFDVEVDGKSRPLALKPGMNTYTVIVPPGNDHVVRFKRRDSGLSGDTHITTIKADQ